MNRNTIKKGDSDINKKAEAQETLRCLKCRIFVPILYPFCTHFFTSAAALRALSYKASAGIGEECYN